MTSSCVSRLVSNNLTFSRDNLVDIHLATILWLSNVSELRIGAKPETF